MLGSIQAEIDLFEERLDQALQSEVELVHQVARYLAPLKGKRLRPALAVLSTRAAGGWDERVIDAGVAVEMIHTATMIHDDVVDAAGVRRGRESINAVWDSRIAVLMGDFLLSRALNILVDLKNQQALETVSRVTERLSQGEIYEIQIGRQADTREASYFAMVSDKTASLIAASCKLGPILVGASQETIEALGRYGEALGLAFQIADDVLDFTGDADTLGKPVGHDLREGKITLPLIRALAAAPPAEREKAETLLRQVEKTEAEWGCIVAFVEDHQGLRSARQTARQYGERAEESLQMLPASFARLALQQAARLVVERDS
ncbi:MAG: polyprenyl synthetase family protein [Candidatus Handelsmanbacteria bacterium]|nr:polyprenyl synthetase family protein [Candidatus Handelsmanbacteria bacterium]